MKRQFRPSLFVHISIQKRVLYGVGRRILPDGFSPGLCGCRLSAVLLALNSLAWVSIRARVLNSARGIPYSIHAHPIGGRDDWRDTRRGI